MSSDQVYGVTPPISITLPTEPELRATGTLIEELKRENTFEPPTETEKRKRILISLEQITIAFVKLVAQKKEPKNEILIRNAIGKVFPYGSFLLGVYGPGSDIDTLIVAPKYVTRDDYFEHYPKLLMNMAPEGAITGLTAVSDAFVPIIKFEYWDISIDLNFSRIIQKQLDPNLNLQDNALLRGLDETELRSINGTRVATEMLSLIPEKSTFRMALRAIKLWAQRRAIYANIVGFPGGIAWAIMVARVCQLYPKATPAVIVNKFFLIISQWQWPQPVLLKSIESGPLPVRVWNPKNCKADSYHIMPVITPAYPSMCSTFNIGRSSMTVVQRELKRALEISEEILTEKRPWRDLFIKHTFFTTGYRYYICVVSSSKNREAHDTWSGFVESKVRVLVQKLEKHPSIALAHAFNKGYERRHRPRSDEQVIRVQDGHLDYVVPMDDEPVAIEAKTEIDQVEKVQTEINKIKQEVGGADDTAVKNESLEDTPMETTNGTVSQQNGDSANGKDITPSGTEEKTDGTAPTYPPESDIFTMTHYIGIELAEGAKSLDLSYQVNEFKVLCTAWQKYVDDLKDVATISIQHVRSVDLPDDVFGPGEKKPQKKTRVKKAANGKKREATEDQQPPAKRLQPSVATAG